MPVILLAVWKYIISNKWVQIALAAVLAITLITTLIVHEVNGIKHRQELKDELKQEQLYNQALTDQINRDKVIIDDFNKQIEIDKQKELTLQQTTKTIIENNPTWARNLVPPGLSNDLNN